MLQSVFAYVILLAGEVIPLSIQKFIVSKDESIYEAWPDLVQTDSGKLICVFSECENHIDRRNARIMITESADRGRTWSSKKPLTEQGTAEHFFNCARISKLRDGRLAILCDKITRHENSQSELYLWIGDAEGTSWCEPEQYSFCGIVPDKLLQLKSGRFIVAAHFLNEQTQKLEQYLWYSDDGRKTWSDRITVAADPRYNLCEVSILEHGDVLIAYMRENSRLGCDILKTYSYDGGQTWSEIYHTSIDGGHRPVAGVLNDGNVMITYRYIPCHAQNVFAAFIDHNRLLENRRYEQAVRTMPLDYDRNPAPDLGYTGWTQFDDDEIYIVNYIKDDSDKAHIRGYSFYPRDAVLPQTDTNTKSPF